MSPHRRAWAWLSGHPWATSLVVVALVAGAGAAGLTHANAVQDRRQACVERWADQVSGVVTASGRLWSDVARQLREHTQDRARFEGLLAEYEAAAGDAELARLRC